MQGGQNKKGGIIKGMLKKIFYENISVVSIRDILH